MMTAEQILAIEVGTLLQINHSVHVVHGADPACWGSALRVVEITYRGETADCNPKGGGLPYVGVRCAWAREENPTSWISWGIGVGDRSTRVVVQ